MVSKTARVTREADEQRSAIKSNHGVTNAGRVEHQGGGRSTGRPPEQDSASLLSGASQGMHAHVAGPKSNLGGHERNDGFIIESTEYRRGVRITRRRYSGGQAVTYFKRGHATTGDQPPCADGARAPSTSGATSERNNDRTNEHSGACGGEHLKDAGGRKSARESGSVIDPFPYGERPGHAPINGPVARLLILIAIAACAVIATAIFSYFSPLTAAIGAP